MVLEAPKTSVSVKLKLAQTLFNNENTGLKETKVARSHSKKIGIKMRLQHSYPEKKFVNTFTTAKLGSFQH